MKTAKIPTQKFSKFVAILMIFALISPGIFAQKSLKNDLVAELANDFLTSGKMEIIAAMETDNDIPAIEMNMEDWMKDPNNWNKTDAFSPASVPTYFYEAPLEFEDWMERTNWNKEFDQELEIENWMTNPSGWIKEM